MEFPYTIGRSLLTRGNPDGLGRKRNTRKQTLKGSRTLEHLMTFLRLEVKGKRWCSWQNPVWELLSEKKIPQLKGG
ncbi:hypothetical protein TNCV_1700331 [Trichonephila clavipes]|nr:hypothetical protein TNCV_1700331 [Trichonephila clavipes]